MSLTHYNIAPELTDSYIDAVWETLPLHIRPTLLLPAPVLSARLGCEITIASETFQYTGSFKFRAAYNLLSSVPEQRVVTASSGNFGQAVAYACRLLGKTCTVVMPSTSASVKIAAVQANGGIVDLVDVQTVSRNERVQQLLFEQPGAFQAQAYDDYRVVAGNSTLTKEILGAADVDFIVVPVGGGGLSSGQIIARDHLNACAEIIGAEPQPGNDAARSLRSGTRLFNDQEPTTVADGARTLGLGELNWEIIRRGMADIIEVPDAQSLEALRQYFTFANLKVEPTGALSLGAIMASPARFQGKKVCCI
ncbi:MAG TPA: pyridoxal-phosphate dependent enzyme, partial [Ktedonobacteraceae bacterium]|nr:pyridoxal-phosphate dependent enzyme [Ktedonobacteraceae bacterium]